MLVVHHARRGQSASLFYGALSTLAIVGLVFSPLQPALKAAAASRPAAPQTQWRAPLFVPALTATKADALFTDVDGDTQVDPGDTLSYTVTLTNTGTDGLGVTFSDTLDANTTLVGGSVNVAPIAVTDVYTTVGNTLLVISHTAPAGPTVFLSGSAFSNDLEYLGDTLSLLTYAALSAQGGSVTMDAAGRFSYLPPVGFTGTDTFTYTVADGTGATDNSTVTIHVVNRVWYVKNDAAGGGDGRSNSPFNTLAAAQTASTVNDTIYVFAGNGTTTGQNAGITLQTGQRLLGEGVALTMPVSVDGVSPSVTLRGPGSFPLIENTSGNGVSITNVSNVEIRGLNIAGSTNAVDVTTNGTSGGSFELANNIISSAGAEGVDVNGGGSGTLTISLHDNTITASGNGIDIQRTAGSVIITALADNVVSGNTGGTGINIVGVGATILLDANPGTAAFETVAGGVTLIGQSGNGVGASGLVLDNMRGDLSFSDLDIYADNGRALFVDGTTANYTGSSGLRFTANTGTPTFVANGGAAVQLQELSVNLQSVVINSTNSTSNGVSLFDVSGTFSASSGSSITNAANADFFINGNNTAAANVAVAYAGTITDDTGVLVQIQNVTGSSTHVFSGAITDGDDGDGNGVSLTNNSGATITFSGGLVLSTGAQPAFIATGGGTVNVCDEHPCNPAATGALINKLTTTTGTALNVANTTIGANKLEFRSISANGATNGIVLNNTGASGGLKVTGTGVVDSGGVIQNTSGDGIVVTDTQDLSLSYIRIRNPASHGINATNLRGTSLLANSTIIDFTNANANGFEINNNNTNLTLLTITGSTFDGAATSNAGVSLEVQGTSNVTLSVEGNSLFTDMFGDGLQATTLTGFTGVISVTVKNSTFNNAATNGNGGLYFAPFGGPGTFNFSVTNNTFDTLMRPLTNLGAINITDGDLDGSGPTVNGIIQGNVLNNIIGSRGISVIADTFSGPLNLTVDNNQIDRLGSTTKHAINIGLRDNVTNAQIKIRNNQIGQAANLWTSGNGTAEAVLVLTQNNATANVLLQGNVIDANATLEVMRVRAINTSTQNVTVTGNDLNDTSSTHIEFAGVTVDTATMCLNISGNVVSAPIVGVIQLTEAATGPLNVTQASALDVATLNNNATVLVTGSPQFGQPACTLPSGFVSQKQAFAKAPMRELTPRLMSMVRAAERTGATQLNPQLMSKTDLTGGKALLRVAEPKPVLSGENINLNLGLLPAGEKFVITFRATVDNPFPAGPTQVCNQGAFSGSNFSVIVTNDPETVTSGDATCTPVDVKADLSLTKSDGGLSAQPGETVVYTLHYTNAATSTINAVNTLITETLPANTTYVESGWTLVGGSTYTRSVGTVNIGASGSVTFAVRVNNTVAAGLEQITNTASIGFPGLEVNAADNTATDSTPIVAAPDLELSKHDGEVTSTPGAVVTYTLTYTNTGNQDATGVTLTETVPAQTTFVGTGWSCAPDNTAGSVCTYLAGAVSGGGGASAVTFTVQIVNQLAAGVTQISNTATVADDGSNGVDATPANNIATELTPVEAAPDYTMTKTDGVSSTLAGQTLTYTLTYSNTGNQAGAGVTLTEQVPTGATFNAGASTVGWTLVSGSTYTYAVGALNAGMSGVVIFGVTVDDPPTTLILTNTASIGDDGANGVDATPANNTATDVNIVGVPPVLEPIGNQNVNEGVTLTFTATATDGNAPPEILTFSLDAGAPSGASIDGNSGVFNWTPTEAQGPGVYTVTVRVTDNGSPAQSDFETITITVNEVNTAPALDVIGPQSVDELATLTFTATVTDTDAPPQTLTFSLDAGAPSGASIDGNSGVFSWTPTELQGPGVYTVTVRVTDDGSPTFDDSETITLTVNDVNSAPVLGVIGPQSVDELATLTFTATVTDTDAPPQTLTFSLDAGAPSGASIDGNSGVFNWTPTELQGPGAYTVTVRVTDDGSPAQEDFETITLVVNEANAAPTLGLIGPQSVNELTTLTFTATVTDTDAPPQTLTFSLDAGAPSGASIGGSNGVFNWTPTEAQGPGVYTVTVRVTDNGLPSQNDFEEVVITVAEANSAPVADDDTFEVEVDSVNNTLNVLSGDTDADLPAQTLTIVAFGPTSNGGALSNNGATLSYTPTAGFDGTETFTYTVGDGNGGVDTALVTVTVSSTRYLYLPLVARNHANAPDLVVQNLTSNGSNVQVVLANQGSACVASAAQEFWVDVYVNPSTPPTTVNQIWSNLSAQGLVWGVTSSAFPLCPGQTLTLTVGDAYYSPLDSVVSFPLPNGTPLYAQVDSFNLSTTYGAVRETHEILGGIYNNIRASVVSVAAGADLPLPPMVFVERERDVNLPKRPD